MNTKYYLIAFQQRWHERSDWQYGNGVTTNPGKYFLELKARNDHKADSVFLSATEITKGAYTALKDTL